MPEQPVRDELDQGASASRPGSREPSPDGLGPTGFDPSRIRVLEAAADITATAKAHPELFDVKTRAIGIWRRLLFWTVGLCIGSLVDHYARGHTVSILPMFIGMMFVTAFVYFDPPPVRTTYTLRKRDSDGSPKGGDAEGGSVACDDSAGRQASPKSNPKGDHPCPAM